MRYEWLPRYIARYEPDFFAVYAPRGMHSALAIATQTHTQKLLIEIPTLSILTYVLVHTV